MKKLEKKSRSGLEVPLTLESCGVLCEPGGSAAWEAETGEKEGTGPTCTVESKFKVDVGN